MDEQNEKLTQLEANLEKAVLEYASFLATNNQGFITVRSKNFVKSLTDKAFDLIKPENTNHNQPNNDN
jgi:hypothetical protein